MREILAACLGLLLGLPALAVGLGAPGSAAFSWKATELSVNGPPQRGFISVPPNQWSGTRRQCLYLLEVWPGRSYTLGLRIPSQKEGPEVSFYDRWPSAQGARKIRLPAGPVVKTNPRGHRYCWQFSVSPASTGTALYILLAAKPSGGSLARLPHTIFVTSPPLSPSRMRGQGITFLQGPRNFRLASAETPLMYAVERTETPAEAGRQLPLLPLPGDLVKNGGFRQDLDYWQPRKEGKAVDTLPTLAVQAGSLRLSSASGRLREGIRQEIQRDVSGAGALVLRADIKITGQTWGELGSAGKRAPVLISVGYLDAEGKEHAGENAYQAGFYLLEPGAREQVVDRRRVKPGQWFRFQTDLLRLEPAPKIITYLSIEGAGWPEREGWVREVHLIKAGEIQP